MAGLKQGLRDQVEWNRLKVILRVRPPDKREADWIKKREHGCILREAFNHENADTRVIIERTNKSYDFDAVFRQDSTQRMLFREAALPTLENVFSGYCGAVVAYGQTVCLPMGSPQTYSTTSPGNKIKATAQGMFDERGDAVGTLGGPTTKVDLSIGTMPHCNTRA